MSDFLDVYKKPVTDFLDGFLFKKGKKLTGKNRWGPDLIKKYRDFFKRGKLIRGSLLVWAHEAYSGNNKKDAVLAAAALELFQSAILIHDDIIDNDRERRGRLSIFADYQSLAKEERIMKDSDFGKGMGICSADIGFFLVFEILSMMEDDKVSKRIAKVMSEEFISVGLGEMQDLYMGMSNHEFCQKEILEMYKQKTSGYSFSLPLVCGCIIAGGEADLDKLETIGLLTGLIYQVRDDYLGIFGKTPRTGKPEGSDISENKKTLFRSILFETKKAGDPVLKLFGNKLSSSGLEKIRSEIQDEGITDNIVRMISGWKEEAFNAISRLGIPEEKKGELMFLIKWLEDREY